MKFLDNLRMIMAGEVPTSTLIKRGMKVGKNFSRQKWVVIDSKLCWMVNIGDDVTLAPKVYILCHDASTKQYIGYTKVGKVTIGNRVFIGANSTILPGVTIGNDVIVGANSLVSKDLPSDGVYVGSPCKLLCSIEEFKKNNAHKLKECKEQGKSYDNSLIFANESEKQAVLDNLTGIGFCD